MQATRRKRAKPKKPAQKNKNVKRAESVDILKPHPKLAKQEITTNARVLLRANDVRGVQMKSVTFTKSDMSDGFGYATDSKTNVKLRSGHV
jgi:hypothetical protein